jgi:hypothetical protein
MDMDHAEALELIELAAVEPDGFERLVAGDTPQSSAVAGHLAGCPACVEQLAHIQHTATLAREVIRSQPDPALRERTLALVREVGQDRSALASTEAGPVGMLAAPPSPAASPPPRPIRPAWTRPPWVAVAGIAAALILAVGLGYAVATIRSPADDLRSEVAVLQATTAATLRLEAAPDTQRVALTATEAGAGSAGDVLFSPSSEELLLIATGLAPLEPGQEYGCWLEVNGERRRIGEMYAGGDLQSWAGQVDGLADLPPESVFGVSLVPEDGSGIPVLTGST